MAGAVATAHGTGGAVHYYVEEKVGRVAVERRGAWSGPLRVDVLVGN